MRVSITPSHRHRYSGPSVVRAAILFCVLLPSVTTNAAPDSPAIGARKHLQRQTAGASKPAASQNAVEQRGTESAPLFVKSLPGPESEAEAAHKEYERHEKPFLDRWLTYSTGALAVFTLLLFLFTAALWWVTLQLARHAKRESERQAKETQRSLSISEQAATAAQQSADAVVSTSMPVLFPKVVGMNGLHPLIPIATPFTHESNIFIKFENFGGTPAMIREIRAKLYVTANDALPEPNPAEWPRFPYEVMIPGNSGAEQQTFGALDMKQTVVYAAGEISELHAEASAPAYRRFVLMGQVTYDDFFGYRHMRTFSVKMRAWTSEEAPLLNVFQIGVGGAKYNKWAKYVVPSPDPLEQG